MTTLAHISLGSNIGDRQAHLRQAVAALSATPGVQVRAVSPIRETNPVGGPSGQGLFLNAAATLETALPADQLLLELQRIEHEAGRVRTVRWGERTLDLDVLLVDDAVIAAPTLQVPHSRMALRRFVLGPFAEIAPDAVDPLTRQSVASLLANLDRRPSIVALADSSIDALCLRNRLARELENDHWHVQLVSSLYPDSGRASEPTIQPTFVIKRFIDPLPSASARRSFHAQFPGVPLLLVDNLDSESTVSEILAACAATRAG